MTNIPTTAILLATYNSAKYLRAQLDSLYKQTLRDWILVVHDDGSKDETLKIIEEYQLIYHNIIVIGNDIHGLGPQKNFMYLLENVDAQYYLFCDHDDIWLPDKVEKAISTIKKHEGSNKSLPVVYHSDLTVVDGNLNVISNSLWQYAKVRPDLMRKKNFVMTSCFITGCTLAINNAAKQNIPPIDERAIMHDWWIGIHSVLQGMTLISDPSRTILYRLHGNNDSGIPHIQTIQYIRNIISSFFVSNYDRNVRCFVKEYGIRHYTFFKALLILRKLTRI